MNSHNNFFLNKLYAYCLRVFKTLTKNIDVLVYETSPAQQKIEHVVPQSYKRRISIECNNNKHTNNNRRYVRKRIDKKTIDNNINYMMFAHGIFNKQYLNNNSRLTSFLNFVSPVLYNSIGEQIAVLNFTYNKAFGDFDFTQAIYRKMLVNFISYAMVRTFDFQLFYKNTDLELTCRGYGFRHKYDFSDACGRDIIDILDGFIRQVVKNDYKHASLSALELATQQLTHRTEEYFRQHQERMVLQKTHDLKNKREQENFAKSIRAFSTFLFEKDNLFSQNIHLYDTKKVSAMPIRKKQQKKTAVDVEENKNICFCDKCNETTKDIFDLYDSLDISEDYEDILQIKSSVEFINESNKLLKDDDIAQEEKDAIIEDLKFSVQHLYEIKVQERVQEKLTSHAVGVNYIKSLQ